MLDFKRQVVNVLPARSPSMMPFLVFSYIRIRASLIYYFGSFYNLRSLFCIIYSSFISRSMLIQLELTYLAVFRAVARLYSNHLSKCLHRGTWIHTLDRLLCFLLVYALWLLCIKTLWLPLLLNKRRVKMLRARNPALIRLNHGNEHGTSLQLWGSAMPIHVFRDICCVTYKDYLRVFFLKTLLRFQTILHYL